MKNLITGGAGFIGSHLAEALIAMDQEVVVIDDLSTGFEQNIPRGAIFHKVDISNAGRLSALSLPEEIDCVFHCAAQSSGEASFDDPVKDIDLNYKATYNVLNLVALKKCKRFIFSSSTNEIIQLIYFKLESILSAVL